MFTVELRINGVMVGHVYGTNKGPVPYGKGETKYDYEYYEPDGDGVVRGSVMHKREDGLRHLVKLILDDI